MTGNNKKEKYYVFLNIILCGALWGIFEATVGYLLHSVSFGYSWMVWYPVACFFMAAVYHKTKRASSIIYLGLFCSAVKMLNLFLPGNVDRVINPAVSIVLETLLMAAATLALDRLSADKRENPFVKALAVLAMNTGWRFAYILYLFFLVPGWMREISVISSADKFISFFIIQKLVTSVIIFIGYLLMAYLIKPLEIIERRISVWRGAMSDHFTSLFMTGFTAFLLCMNIVLQFMLK